MKRPRSIFVCQSCGSTFNKWMGRCEDCNAWNSVVEEQAQGPAIAAVTGGQSIGGKSKRGRVFELTGLQGDIENPPRISSGIGELDRVTGGGFVEGSVVLIGGDPGIGKSTLLLQASAACARMGHKSVYISGEEAVAQVRLRAQRLGLADAPVALASETAVEDIMATLSQNPKPDVAIIDSIQTLWSGEIDSAPGTVTQLRAAVHALVRFAKTTGVTLILVGHVTKDGQIAGPRVVEHMVDAVFYFEGDNHFNFRILRAVKNRFGATDELGIFEMTGSGLKDVPNPSALFLENRDTASPGTCVFAGLEGTRALLTELQALVAPTVFGSPRRAVVGWDSNRLSMIVAVLESRCKVKFGTHDIYLNVAGGLKIAEPGADLAAALALISALTQNTIAANTIILGEISLTGGVRPVQQATLRLREAQKMGFTHAIIPEGQKIEGNEVTLGITRVTHVRDAIAWLMG